MSKDFIRQSHNYEDRPGTEHVAQDTKVNKQQKRWPGRFRLLSVVRPADLTDCLPFHVTKTSRATCACESRVREETILGDKRVLEGR